MAGYQNKVQKVIQKLAQKQVRAAERQFIGTLITVPVLKAIPGPDSPRPLREGENPEDFPGSVLTWFSDVRLDADKALLRDVLVPTQARGNIGDAGSPVVVYKDPSTGAWQVVGRADRSTEFQTVNTYTLLELRVGYLKGLSEVAAGEYATPFYQYHPFNEHVVTRDGPNGEKNFGLNKGVQFDEGGEPIVEFQAGFDCQIIPLGELNFGVDGLQACRDEFFRPDGGVGILNPGNNDLDNPDDEFVPGEPGGLLLALPLG